jgi:hypothetical protein
VSIVAVINHRHSPHANIRRQSVRWGPNPASQGRSQQLPPEWVGGVQGFTFTDPPSSSFKHIALPVMVDQVVARHEDPLGELVRQGENVIASQIRVMDGQDSKIRHLLTLSGGVLVVAVATSGLVAGRPLGPFFGLFEIGVFGFLIPVTISFGASFTAFLLFANAYNGTKRQPYKSKTGWNPEVLVQAAEEGDELKEIHRSTIHGIREWFLANQKIIEHSTRSRSWGMKLLFVSGASLAVSLIYAVGAIIQ